MQAHTSGLCSQVLLLKKTLPLPEGKQHRQPINELICTLLIDSVSQKMDGSVTGGLRGTLVLLD